MSTHMLDGHVTYLIQDILRVMYPHALDKELAEMLSVVIPKKHVKGQSNLEQQVAELKEVFAVYDEDGTGQLNQATFVEAIVSAGGDSSLPVYSACTACKIMGRFLESSTVPSAQLIHMSAMSAGSCSLQAANRATTV